MMKNILVAVQKEYYEDSAAPEISGAYLYVLDILQLFYPELYRGFSERFTEKTPWTRELAYSVQLCGKIYATIKAAEYYAVQECDATGDAICSNARHQKLL